MQEDVRTHVFHRIVQDIKARNAGTDPDELQAPIDDTVREGTGELRSPESGSWRTRADLEVCPRLNS
jgi:hypothetical protein